MICPKCFGKKEIDVFPKITLKGRISSIPCSFCEETGEVSDSTKDFIRVGKNCRNERIKFGLTLRDACKQLNIEFQEGSDMELGKKTHQNYWKN